MSNRSEHGKSAASMQNNTGAKDLAQLLRADAPETDAFDAQLTARVAEVMSHRENNDTAGEFRTPQQAWEDFETNYLPRLEEDQAPRQAEYCTQAPARKQPRKGRVYRVAAAAAVVAVCLMLTVSAGAGAKGLSLWGTIGRWTEETFGFAFTGSEQGYNDAAQVPAQLAELKEYMEKYGVTAGVLPTYLPEGYETVETQCIPNMETIDFSCFLSNGEDTIALQYTLHLTADFPGLNEKDEPKPEDAKVNGVTYNIMTNMDVYRASWVVDKTECNIFGLTSKDELLKILESIE